MTTPNRQIVLELGACWIRAGLGGRHHPTYVEATPGALLSGGRVQCLEQLSIIFTHGLQIRPKECVVVVVEKATTAREHRTNVLHVLLKDLQVQAVTMQMDLCMTILASGSSNLTGLVVDIGCRETRLMAVALGRPILQTLRIVGIGMAQALDVFSALLLEHLEILPAGTGEGEGREEGIASLFQKVANAAPDCPDVTVSPKDWLNGQSFALPAALRRVPLLALINGQARKSLHSDQVEVLHPEGVAGALAACALACNHDIRKHCLANVVVCGGGGLVPDLPRLLCDEAWRLLSLTHLAAPSSPRPTPASHAFSADSLAWTGAALFASAKSAARGGARERFITLKDFEARQSTAPDWQSLDAQDWIFSAPVPPPSS